MTENGAYIIVIALLVAELFKIYIFAIQSGQTANYSSC